jgi:hypothetical protein
VWYRYVPNPTQLVVGYKSIKQLELGYRSFTIPENQVQPNPSVREQELQPVTTSIARNSSLQHLGLFTRNTAVTEAILAGFEQNTQTTLKELSFIEFTGFNSLHSLILKFSTIKKFEFYSSEFSEEDMERIEQAMTCESRRSRISSLSMQECTFGADIVHLIHKMVASSSISTLKLGNLYVDYADYTYEI